MIGSFFLATQIYIDQSVFFVSTDPAKLREHDYYQSVKEAINSRNRFLFGTTSWEEVYNKCKLLGTSIGVDFLMATYYTVASLKFQGLKSYADGLELMLHCYLQDLKHGELAPKHKKDIIDWMVGQVVDELKVAKPDKTALRELYRCERALQELYELCSHYQPSLLPNIESVAFILFEYIDRFDTALVAKSELSINTVCPGNNDIAQHKKLGRFKSLFIWVTVCGLAAFSFWYIDQQTQSEKLMRLVSDQMNRSVLSENQKWLNAQPIIEHFASQNEQRQALFQQKYQQMKEYRAEQSAELNADLERFYVARTNAANVVKQLLSGDTKSTSAKELENYVLGLSPVYARLDYIDQLISQKDYHEADKELLILDNRLSRIINDMGSKQSLIVSRTHKESDGVTP